MFPATIRHALLATTLALAPLPALADAQVVMKNFDFSPMAVTIKHGESVVWKNLDGEPHTVVSVDGAFRSAALDQDDTYKFTFDKPGVYKYLCSIHPKMTGIITVR
ncbi:MAG TPA: cupredoxin family copper-binding protein [Rhizomicrobium sp.]|nr:cupredoxin family copper-binding protein [Rhizomicrobium sp.]